MIQNNSNNINKQPLKPTLPVTPQDITNNYFLFNNTKNDDDAQPDLPLLPLNSRFSVNSTMNPVRGLEMKRLISVNPEGAAEPYIDLSHGYSQLFSNYNQPQQQQQQQNQQQQLQQLTNNQSSFMPDLTTQQSNNNNNNNGYFANFNASNNQQSMNFDLLSPAFMEAASFQNTLNAAPRQIYEQIQQQQNKTQQQQQNQQFFNNHTGPNNNNSSTNGTDLQSQLFQAQGNANNNNNNNNSNLIFKNPDALSGNRQNTLLSNTNIPNYLATLGAQQQNVSYDKDFQEKKEEPDVDNHNNNNNIGNSYQNLNSTTGLQLSNDDQLKNNNNNYAMSILKQQQQLQQQFQAHQQQQQQFQNTQSLFYLQQQQQQQQQLHQQYINHDEAEYMNEARSHGEEDQHRYLHQNPYDSAGNNNHRNNNALTKGNNNMKHHLNGSNHNGQDDNDYDEDDEGYTNNMDSHTRHKTEWPSRPKGQTKYQQCRHRNIFKNFGNIFRKFVSFHNHFTEKALGMLGNQEESLKAFQRWLKKDIRLENKKDFIEGWTIWVDEDEQIRQFKILLKELSRDFFQDYILIYLLNSKLQDLEIHLRSIGPCLAAINLPSILYKFRPI